MIGCPLSATKLDRVGPPNGDRKFNRSVGWPAASSRCVTDRFDVVSVRIEDKRTVIIRVVVRAQPRRAIVPAARRQRRAVERINQPPADPLL